MADYKVDGKFDAHVPSLEELVNVLHAGLSSNFANVKVQVTDCPDLTKEPFGLAMKGLHGNPVIADVGGPNNLTPLVNREKVFNIPKVLELVGKGKGSAIGPGAGPWTHIGVNSEMIANVALDQKPQIQSYFAKVDEKDGQTPVLLHAKDIKYCADFALMANLFISDGLPGKVIHVNVSKRTNAENFVRCMAKALTAKYGETPVSMGGVFIIKKGKAKLHIMPDFSTCPLNTDAAVDKWLHYYDMSAPLVCLSVFHSHDPGLKLRMDHTHCFSQHGEGGHYHYDVTPDEVEYDAYLLPANTVYRIDQC